MHVTQVHVNTLLLRLSYLHRYILSMLHLLRSLHLYEIEYAFESEITVILFFLKTTDVIFFYLYLSQVAKNTLIGYMRL